MPGHTVVNIWHGMPLKKICLLDRKGRGRNPCFDFTIAYDADFLPVIADSFGVDRSKVLINLHPRMDVFNLNCNASEGFFRGFNRFFVWLPTYRDSAVGHVRHDGSSRGKILEDQELLTEMNSLCREFNVLFLIKPHPMDSCREASIHSLSNLKVLEDSDLAFSGLTLYQLIASSSGIVTDVSSVVFDCQALKLPAILFCPDLEEYMRTRGLISEMVTKLEQKIISDSNEFLREIRKMLGIVSFEGHQHSYHRASATLSLWKKIGAI